MNAQENTQVVKNAYAAFGRRDIPALLALLAEDVEWHIPGTGLPLSGTYVGPRGVANFFQKLSSEAEILEFEPRHFVAEGDRVVVLGWERSRVRASGHTVEYSWTMAMVVRDGKIVKFEEYADTQAIAAAYGTTARAAGTV